jgi:hypothetical protein
VLIDVDQDVFSLYVCCSTFVQFGLMPGLTQCNRLFHLTILSELHIVHDTVQKLMLCRLVSDDYLCH